MSTPFHASKLGVIILLSITLWAMLLGSIVAMGGPKHLEHQMRHKLASIHSDVHFLKQRAEKIEYKS